VTDFSLTTDRLTISINELGLATTTPHAALLAVGAR
jgi:hypothetical protein